MPRKARERFYQKEAGSVGFLDKLFGKKEEPKMELAAPLAGEAVSISQVNDPTFSDEILGKGLAIRPTGNEVFAPCDGKIEMMFDTGETVFKVHSTVMQPQGSRVGINIVPFNIHIMKPMPKEAPADV